MGKYKVTKFDSHKIAEFIVDKVALLSDFRYAKDLQREIKTNSLEIVVVLDKHAKEISDIYTLVNHQISINKKIETFFRSGDGRSFLFPAGVNVHFVTPKELGKIIDRWNVICGVFEAPLYSSFMGDLKEAHMESLLLEDTVIHDMDKEITSYWKKN